MYNRQIINKQNQLQAANRDLERYNSRIRGMTQDILYMYEAVNTDLKYGYVHPCCTFPLFDIVIDVPPFKP
jgi:hypothetical protein